MFLPNVTKIDLYNFELYRFKIGAFFEPQCSYFMLFRLALEAQGPKCFLVC